MKILAYSLTIIVLSLMSFSMVNEPGIDPNMKNPFINDKSATAYGAKVYKKHCWLCHGNNGMGNGPGAAEISTKPADFSTEKIIKRTDAELYTWIIKGGNDMQPYKGVLTNEDIWKVINYIRKIQSE